jgi:DNA mismatch repair protein MutS2
MSHQRTAWSFHCDTDTRQALEVDRLLAWIAEGALTFAARRSLLAAEAPPSRRAWQEERARLREWMVLLDRAGSPGLSSLEDGQHVMPILLEKTDFLEGSQCLDLVAVLELCDRLREALSHDEYSHLTRLAQELGEFPDEIEAVRKRIGEDGQLRDTASPQLGGLRRKVEQEERRLAKELSRVEAEWRGKGHLGDTGLSWRDGRPVLPVQAGSYGRVEGMVVDQSQSGQTLFVEPAIAMSIRAGLSRTRVELRQEEVRILSDLSAILREARHEIAASWKVMLAVDSLNARARWGRSRSACITDATDEMHLVIHEGRHPLLEKQHPVVPLELALKRDRVLLISGPNAGGKTVALKTAALFAVMTMLVLPVPCAAESRIPCYTCVVCDIGDRQSIENDLSTYSGHLARMKAILENASRPGLFIVDELGSGTDPEEGSAVAMAFLERMLLSPGMALISTHLGQLKAFAHDTEGIENASMSFDELRIEPTYRLVQGVPGSSYALEILQRMDLPKVLLDRARHHMGSEQKNLARLIGKLQTRLAAAEKDRRAAEARKIELESLTEQYRQKMQGVRREEKEIKRRAVEEAARLVKDSNRLIEGAVREIREAQAGKEVVRAAREKLVEQQKTLGKQERKLAPRKTQSVAAPAEIRVGDRVRLEGLDTPARVTRIEKNGRKLQVEAGVMKMTVELARITEVLPAESRKERAAAGGISISTSDPGMRLDLRGRSAEEAAAELDAYVDDCLVSGLGFATILHGKGSGVLRQVVQDRLRELPRVISIRDGQPEEGGDGVTIIKLDV